MSRLAFWKNLAVKIAKQKPIYLYHGTSLKNLNSILSQGLIPDPKERKWNADPDSGWETPSRISLGGIYFTSNLMIALSSMPSKRDGGLLVIAQIQPESLIMDEDDLLFANNIVAPDWNPNRPKTIAELYIAYKYPDAITDAWLGERIKSLFEELRQHYANDIISIVESKLGKPIHSELKKRVYEIGLFGFSAVLTRKVAYIDDYIWRSCWYEFINNNPDAKPSASEGEAKYRQFTDQLTKTLKILANPNNLVDGDFSHIARTLAPVRFSGSNKIAAIYKIFTDDEYETHLERVYPLGQSPPKEMLEKLRRDWRAVGKSGIEDIK